MFVESAVKTFFRRVGTDVLTYQICMVKTKVGDLEVWDCQTKLSVYSPEGDSFLIKSREAPKEGLMS